MHTLDLAITLAFLQIIITSNRTSNQQPLSSSNKWLGWAYNSLHTNKVDEIPGSVESVATSMQCCMRTALASKIHCDSVYFSLCTIIIHERPLIMDSSQSQMCNKHIQQHSAFCSRVGEHHSWKAVFEYLLEKKNLTLSCWNLSDVNNEAASSWASRGVVLLVIVLKSSEWPNLPTKKSDQD